MKETLQRSVLRLRNLVPMIACRTILLSSGKYQFQYSVLKSASDEKEWVDEVVVLGNPGPSARANHVRLAGERWWKASEGRYVHEFHAAPVGGGDSDSQTASWTIS